MIHIFKKLIPFIKIFLFHTKLTGNTDKKFFDNSLECNY